MKNIFVLFLFCFLAFLNIQCFHPTLSEKILSRGKDYAIGLNGSGLPYPVLANQIKYETGGVNVSPEICTSCYRDFQKEHYKILLENYLQNVYKVNYNADILKSLIDDLYANTMNIEQNNPYLTLEWQITSEKIMNVMFYPFKDERNNSTLLMMNFTVANNLENYFAAYTLNYSRSEVAANALKSLKDELFIININDSVAHYLIKH